MANELESTVKYRETREVGGDRGKHFFSTDNENPVRSIDTWYNKEDRLLKGIRISWYDSKTKKKLYGTDTGTWRGIQLKKGEKIEDLTLYRSDFSTGRCGGFKFKTSSGRTFQTADLVGDAFQADGGRLGGICGASGSDVDRLGFVYMNEVVGYYLKNVEYDFDKVKKNLAPRALAHGTLINQGTDSVRMTWSTPVGITSVKHWTSKFSIKFGVKASGEAGVPFLASGKWEVSMEAGFEYNWGESESTTISETVSVGPVEVAGGYMWECVATVKTGKQNIPYKGKAILTYEDGTSEEHDEEGVFDGVVVVDLQTETTGPLKPKLDMLTLPPGEHIDVPQSHPKHPEGEKRTVIVAE